MDAAATPISDSVVTLPSYCALRDARALQRTLVALMAAPGEITLDASVVQRIDTATLQLLVAFIVARSAAGRGVSWRVPTPALIDAAARLGLIDALHLQALG